MVKADTKCNQVNDLSEVVEFLFPSAAPLPTSTSVIQSELTTPKCREVQIEDVPIRGIVDTDSDITILSEPAFQEIVTMSKAPKKEHVNQPTKKPALMVIIH